MPREARKQEAIAYRKWYGTKEWIARREEQLSAQPFCAYCLAQGIRRVATIADHKVPHRGDWHLFFEGELQSLCKPHHDSDKQSEEHRGYRKGFDEGGNPIDPKHPWYGHDDPPTTGPPV